MRAVLFPGQGSQKIGMVKEFYDKYDLAKQIFKDAEAHKTHLEGGDPQRFFDRMAEQGFRFQGQWIAGIEIDTPPAGSVLN